MRRTGMVLAIASAVATIAVAMQALADGPWGCGALVASDPRVEAQIDARAHNITMRRIIEEYMRRWDAAYMRESCDRIVRGETVDLSCLNGRRNWAEIDAIIPDEYYGMSNSALRPYYLALSDEPNPKDEAARYCVDIGAIPPAFQR